MNKNKIHEYREEKNMTLNTLSKLTGLSVGYLCHLEKRNKE